MAAASILYTLYRRTGPAAHHFPKRYQNDKVAKGGAPVFFISRLESISQSSHYFVIPLIFSAEASKLKLFHYSKCCYFVIFSEYDLDELIFILSRVGGLYGGNTN
jgi:hypothetical protein